jgi:uncharacterized protein YdhG (YjbR/CyaY superfamily)
MKQTTSKQSATRSGPAKDMDGYLAALPADMRAALERLRKQIRAAAPKAIEGISWGMPSFKLSGLLVGFAAFKNHCSFFPMSVSVMNAHRKELKPYDTSKGTIRFPADRPLPAALVTKIVKARIAENEARRASKSNHRLPGLKAGACS